MSTVSTGTTAHARQDTPATGVRQVGLNRLQLYAINVLLVNTSKTSTI